MTDAFLRKIEVRDENMHHLHHDAHAEHEVVARFRNSVAFCRVVSFLVDLCTAATGKPTSEVAKEAPSPNVQRLLDVLAEVEATVQQVEPEKTVTRFGNPAFRTLVARLRERPLGGLPDELRAYLLAGLGDAVRVDYGTGHELSFLAFLVGCRQAGLLEAIDLPSVALVVLARYFALVRKLQQRYLLEPAGSRGCWGLDDYQFLPFLVGAAQLSGHPHLRPKSVMDADIRSAYGAEYLYLAAVDHVHTLKVTSFAEHSPMLYDITSVRDWAAVQRGLLSMYNREVLGKHAIVQHFVYSSALPGDAAPEEEVRRVSELIPVSAADRRLGPIAAAPVHHIPCCSDALKFPSTLASSSVKQK
jgi:serine/threonine-protein phosphatase 2A activator